MGAFRFSLRSENGWVGGESLNKLTAGEGYYAPSPGIDIFRNPGAISAGYLGSSIGGATVVDTPFFLKGVYGKRGTSIERQILAYGSAGKLYSINTANDTVTLIATITSPAEGADLHKNYYYYARTTTIGRYGDLTVDNPSTTDSYLTGLTATVNGVTIPHPVKSWGGVLYVGDGNVLRYVLGSESAGTTGSVALTLNADEIITTIENNDQFLIVTTAKDPAAFSGTASPTRAKVYLWNGLDKAPTTTLDFPESVVVCTASRKGETYLFGRSSAYRLEGSTITTFLDLLANTMGQGSASFNRRGLTFKDLGGVRTWGTFDFRLPGVGYTPFVTADTSRGGLLWHGDDTLYMGGDATLYKFSTSAGEATFNSRFIHLSEEEEISEIRVYFDGDLTTDQSVEVRILDEVGNSYTTRTVSYAADGAIDSIAYRALGFTTAVPQLSGFQLALKFTSGTTRGVREAIVFTKKVAQP